MPIYTYVCDVCGEFDEMRPVEHRDAARCPGCSIWTCRRRFTAPTLHTDDLNFTPYYDHGVGKRLETRGEQRSEWKKRGLVGVTAKDRERALEASYSDPAPHKPNKEAIRQAVKRGVEKVRARNKVVING